MKKLVAIFLASLFTIHVIHANPLIYIEKHGWKETEKSKEMNIKNSHSYMLNDEAILIWRASDVGDYIITIQSKDKRKYKVVYTTATYTTNNIEEFKKALQSISKHQIPDVEWIFTEEIK